ncbi:MAG: peptidase T, partial [Ruminococcus sp.]|nr:peptidase T [Ruminococcus sp.]
DIVLNKELNIVLETAKYPEIKAYKGQRIIVTDGTTLLGADDKAGVAEIMAMANTLLNHPEIPHGPVVVAFTPDEEIGAGTVNFDMDRFGADYAYTVDGGGIGELEYETFNAASAVIEITGVNVHTGEAKNKMINAARIAAEFDSMLPAEQRPEFTEGREGFYHLMGIEGSTESAKLVYLIRDHDRMIFENRKAIMYGIGDQLDLRYGAGTVKVNIKDTYYNMREKIEPDFMFLIDNACEVMKELGIEPKIQPIRGGTDGSALSFRGLPCPNICTGGHNYHGRFEYCCADSMEKIVEILVRLTAK